MLGNYTLLNAFSLKQYRAALLMLVWIPRMSSVCIRSSLPENVCPLLLQLPVALRPIQLDHSILYVYLAGTSGSNALASLANLPEYLHHLITELQTKPQEAYFRKHQFSLIFLPLSKGSPINLQKPQLQNTRYMHS